MTTQEFTFPMSGLKSRGQAMLLAIDDYSLPLKRNLSYYISTPKVRPEPVITPSRDDPNAPDSVAAHFYGGVVYEAGRYRMWYYAVHMGEYTGAQLGRLIEGPTCYAESDDGLHWTKPALGQVEWRGSRQNNIIRLAELHTEGVHVIKDAEEAAPQRRYKMVYNYRPPDRKFWTMRCATSPDGLRWTDGAVMPLDAFIEQASLYKHNGLYFVNGQMHGKSEGGHDLGRQAFAVVSPDFEHWLQEPGESFMMPEPADPAQRGGRKAYDQAHIGVGATSFGNVLVGLYCAWHNKPFPTPTDWFGKGATSGDFGLVVSNDGLHFREPVKGHIWLDRRQTPCTPLPGVKYEQILAQGNGILNVGDETLIYHGRWANTELTDDYYAEIALATLPRDRWGALGLWPDQAEGAVWSCPVVLPAAGCQVALNADHAGDMRVEIADARFSLLPAYSGEQSGATQVDGGLDCPVAWPAGDLTALAGETVRLRIHVKRNRMTEPRLYAVYLS